MAWATTVEGRTRMGSKLRTWGTFTSSGGGTGGNIDTALGVCEFIKINVSGASAGGNEPVVNETLPEAGSAITIVTDANEAGYWEAVGK